MNPFELRGPEFLMFYIVFAGAVLAALQLARVLTEKDHPTVRLTDPYLIAYLRAGDTEALRVAALALVDRGILAIVKSRDAFTLKAAPGATARVVQPLEREIVQAFGDGQPLDHAIQQVRAGTVLPAYQHELEANQLVEDPRAPSLPMTRFTMGVAALSIVSAIKIAIGYSRGRPVSFLVMLTLFSIFAAYQVCLRGRPSAYQRVMDDLQSLFAQARSRASWFRPGANTGELVALAAVYGLDDIPASAIPYVADLRDHVKSAYTIGGSRRSVSSETFSFSDWWSSGSSCASSGGDSGSSCGGGGCGGGCGGCGS